MDLARVNGFLMSENIYGQKQFIRDYIRIAMVDRIRAAEFMRMMSDLVNETSKLDGVDSEAVRFLFPQLKILKLLSEGVQRRIANFSRTFNPILRTMIEYLIAVGHRCLSRRW